MSGHAGIGLGLVLGRVPDRGDARIDVHRCDAWMSGWIDVDGLCLWLRLFLFCPYVSQKQG